jgi:NAD+ synthase
MPLENSSVENHIVQWLSSYLETSGMDGYIVGISGGIDSAVTSTLCALTGRKTILLNMPILQTKEEYRRAVEHIADLTSRFPNVESREIDLTSVFEQFGKVLPVETVSDKLSMANTRSRLRMTTLYAVGQANRCLVAGTGNKVEDFGVGFFTKYGDGGVDVSPIADLFKTEVFELGRHLGVVNSILDAKPTDGLWEDGRSDEDQLGATYPELEWAMEFSGDTSTLSDRQKEVVQIYQRFHRANKHKMIPIPVCQIPKELKS